MIRQGRTLLFARDLCLNGLPVVNYSEQYDQIRIRSVLFFSGVKYEVLFTILVHLSCFCSVGLSMHRRQSPRRAENTPGRLPRCVETGNGPSMQFVDANFGEEMRRCPFSGIWAFIDASRPNRGMRSVRYRTYGNEVILLVRSKLTGVWDGLMVRVEPEAPYRIAGIGLRRAKNRQGESKKLSAREIGTELEAFSKKLAAADVFSGAVLLAKDGQVVYKGAFGSANKDFNVANRVDTKFNLGSMNKMFTGVAIAQLVEKGKISYDDPLSKFVPDFPNPEAAKRIQIKHLLTHTAGLGGYLTEKYDAMSPGTHRTV